MPPVHRRPDKPDCKPNVAACSLRYPSPHAISLSEHAWMPSATVSMLDSNELLARAKQRRRSRKEIRPVRRCTLLGIEFQLERREGEGEGEGGTTSRSHISTGRMAELDAMRATQTRSRERRQDIYECTSLKREEDGASRRTFDSFHRKLDPPLLHSNSSQKSGNSRYGDLKRIQVGLQQFEVKGQSVESFEFKSQISSYASDGADYNNTSERASVYFGRASQRVTNRKIEPSSLNKSVLWGHPKKERYKGQLSKPSKGVLCNSCLPAETKWYFSGFCIHSPSTRLELTRKNAQEQISGGINGEKQDSSRHSNREPWSAEQGIERRASQFQDQPTERTSVAWGTEEFRIMDPGVDEQQKWAQPSGAGSQMQELEPAVFAHSSKIGSERIGPSLAQPAGDGEREGAGSGKREEPNASGGAMEARRYPDPNKCRYGTQIGIWIRVHGPGARRTRADGGLGGRTMSEHGGRLPGKLGLDHPMVSSPHQWLPLISGRSYTTPLRPLAKT
ncbi:hypothetical protein FB45DRAFT_859864 [Roridomyces roridus]|uniref:Uncharacterized protein n=1 Tax=Roridomyces roridus TaxID=1738132 RepID=A0AAD7CKZ7_9AGAR|nr:hypothetical protein FB45DRAFT_859864 [Roridomyces roridus]